MNENKSSVDELKDEELTAEEAAAQPETENNNVDDTPAKTEALPAPDKEKKAGAAKAEKNNTQKPSSMSRKMKRGLISAVITVMAVIVVVIANVTASVMTSKLPALTADITGMKSFEISDKTKEIAENLSRKATISFLSDRETYVAIDPYCKQTAILAEEMERCSDGMLTVDYVDIVRNPAFTKDYSTDNLSTTDIIISSGTNRRILKVADLFDFDSYSGSYNYITASHAEQEIDNALISVTSSEMINTAVIADNSGEGPSYFESTLSADGYSVTEINLSTQDIPEGTQMVVVFTPKSDLSESSVQKLRSFLENGGNYGKNMLFIHSSDDTGVLKNLEKLMLEYGMTIDQGYAFEADGSKINSSSQNFFDGVLCSYAADLYTSGISDLSRPVIAGYAKPVVPANEGIATALLKYSEYSGICPFDADDSWSYKDSIIGDVPILAQGTIGKDGKYSSMIVSGSDKIFNRAYYGSDYSNKAYLSEMLATVNGRTQDRVTVSEKVITAYDVQIDRQTAVNLGFLVYALIPIIILGAGFTVFLIRRNR